MEIGRNGGIIPSFAKGIHVLVVDNDKHSLQSIASMLQSFSFKVTTTEEAEAAIKMVIEEKNEPFNLVMANAIESNMNALSILHQTAIPIILMSPKMGMKTTGRAIAEWGCHFLEKPISMQDIELVWQIVYRKIRKPRGENAKQGKKSQIDGTFGRIVNVARGVEWKWIEEEEEEKGENGGKCREGEEKLNPSVNVEEKTNINEGTNKKSRIVWNSKLHRKFTEALSKLGNRKSSPKIILKMMDEPTLTLRQVASHLQKFKSQVKHLNKITASDASSTSFVKNQFQQLPAKRNSITNNILSQQSYITDHNLRQLQVPSSCCLNNPPTQLPSQDLFNSHLRIMNQKNNSNSYETTHPNNFQLKTYGGLFEGMNLVDANRIFADDLYMNKTTLEEGFVQTSHYSNFQYFGADEDYCSFFQDDQFKFAQNLAGSCLDVDNNIVMSTSGAHSVIAGRPLNQNVALKELDDLLNNTEEDPMVYCCYDGEMNSFDIDQYSEWLNA